ncbi:phage tail protein [Citrobacter freundii]|nr:hypothetical protein [Citrobacter freundii]
MDKLIFTITDAGRQEIINASNTGTEKVEIKSVGVGDIYYLTSPDQTEIGGEIKRITGIGGAVISADTIHVSAKDDSNDEYVVHTVGLYTDKGTLFAVYSRKEPIINKSASTVMLISSDITFKSLDTANITFGDVVFINPPASESVVGVSRFATAEEVEEGLDPALSVSAKRLKGELDKKANLDSPNLTGTPTAPTAAESDNSQKIATTAFIKQVLLAYAKLASPNFTGKPTAPTADHSSNDTQIATTAFVRAAIAALVDSSPGALDTLNELAAAIGNDPNFATTMLNALAGKQPLDGTLTNLSGKDVPALLQYLGLVETVNRAAGALQKDQNLNDVPDKAKARKALQLGSAATLDATTAVNDCTLGRVLKVGDFGLGAQTFGVIPDSHPVSERAAYGVNFSRVFKSTDAPRMDTYFNLLMMPETLNGTFAALAMSENTTPCYRAYGVGSNKSIQWAKIYDELNKPTATDVGALPITGGNLLGALRFLSPDARPNTNCMIANDDASGILACQYGYYQDRFDIHFYDEKGAWESNPVSIGRNGNTTVLGNLSGRAVYEGNTRVYSPNNPPPAPNLSGYATQQWVLQNFVQNIDLTAPAEVGFWDGRGYPRGTDGAAMYNFNMVGGSSNVGNFIVRYTRKQVNNTWYVIN